MPKNEPSDKSPEILQKVDLSHTELYVKDTEGITELFRLWQQIEQRPKLCRGETLLESAYCGRFH